MLARSFRSSGVAALATLTMGACASTSVPRSNDDYVALSRVPSVTATSRVFDAERIRRSGAITAWDAVRMLVPLHRLDPARGTSLRMFGVPAMSGLQSSIRMILDGLEMDMDVLRSIPAEQIVSIHVLNASEAAVYLGPRSGGGAIVVQTRSSLRAR